MRERTLLEVCRPRRLLMTDHLISQDMNTKLVGWVLRIAIAGEFIGHGMLAIKGNPQWVGWFAKFGVHDPALATKLLLCIGIWDLIVACSILVKPIRAILLWAVIWGFWTAILRPIVGLEIWDFVERSANWGAPLALLLVYGWPRNFKEWF